MSDPDGGPDGDQWRVTAMVCFTERVAQRCRHKRAEETLSLFFALEELKIGEVLRARSSGLIFYERVVADERNGRGAV